MARKAPKPLRIVNGKKYAFTFKNGNTLVYEMVNKDADNGYGYCVRTAGRYLHWFSKCHVVKIEEAK